MCYTARMAEKLGYEWERMIIGMRKIRLPFVCGNHGKVDGGRVEDELYARQWDFVPGVEMLRCTAVGLLFYIPQFITLRYVEVASHNLFKTRGLLSALFHLYFVQFDCYLYCPNYAEHGEMNRFLMTKTTREMRVVPSYGPNIPSKVL